MAKKKIVTDKVVNKTEIKFTQEEIKEMKQFLNGSTSGSLIVLPKEQLKTVLYNKLILCDENVTEDWIEENLLNNVL